MSTEFCRLCANECHIKLLVNIFADEHLHRAIRTKIFSVLQINVKIDDTLSKNVCLICLGRLDGVCRFVDECLEAQIRLKTRMLDDIQSAQRNSFSTVQRNIMERNRVSASGQMNLRQNDRENSSLLPRTSSPFIENNGEAFAAESSSNNFENLFDKCKPEEKLNAITNGDEDEDDSTSLLTSINSSFDGNTGESLSPNITDPNTGENYGDGDYVEICIDTERRYQCKKCMSVLKNKEGMMKHLKLKHSEPTFQCRQCPKRMVTLGRLTNHIKTVHIRRFACSRCFKGFGTGSELKRHEYNVHGSSVRLVSDICGKKYKNDYCLNRHMKGTHSFKSRQCNVCCQSFTAKGAYISHTNKCGKKVANKSEKYICDICGKCYYKKETLRYHMYQHLNIKPFKCKVCKARFSTPNYLSMHRAVHKDKLFRCPVCDKGFNRKDNLNTHGRTQH